MTVDPQKVALYCQGTFDVPNPDLQQIDKMVAAADDIAASGFGTVLLGQWHVHKTGLVYYNNSPLDSVIQALKVIPTILTQGSVEKVLISFGPFASDFQGIQDNLVSFKKTMDGVQAQTAINGYDWDLEQSLSQFTNLLVDLNQWALGQGLMVTAAPYYDSSFWIDVQNKTTSGGGPGFNWWNLQLYGGASYSQWVSDLQGHVADPQSFLVPGYAVHLGATPQNVQDGLSNLHGSYPDLDGGFIWQYEDILRYGYTAKQFADAIKNGLS